ncbi:unnamed protein product [Rotaria sp. Silwood1]|nr:unnamed protein product [Rotaria sp. Silwood1]
MSNVAKSNGHVRAINGRPIFFRCDCIPVNLFNCCDKELQVKLKRHSKSSRLPYDAEDEIYRNRVKTQNHIPRNRNMTNNWKDSSIVDGIEQLRIGQNAEHFFFVYLQNHYGSIDVTPTKNWRSSSRLITYPQCQRNIDDSIGFDFELHDTKEIFVCGSGSRTKYCYFEVKGTSGSFNETHTRFHISQNELDMCQSIANDKKRQEREAYFIVIIENCIDPEKISFGTAINW